MKVTKRDGRLEEVKFDKITARIRRLCTTLDSAVDPILISQQTIQMLSDGISTSELDRISAEIAESHKSTHPDYGMLASRLLVSNLHKSTPDSFSKCMERLESKYSEEHMDFIRANAAALDAMIKHERDYDFNYMGFKCLEYSYLQGELRDRMVDGKPVCSLNGRIVEARETEYGWVYDSEFGPIPTKIEQDKTIIDRPQYMYMRIAIACFMRDAIKMIEQAPILKMMTTIDIDPLNEIAQYYDGLSRRDFTNATPTMFNACTKQQQLGSCFLLGINDNIKDIMRCLSDSSLISKASGGIAVWFHNIRPSGSVLSSSGGKASGILPQLRMFNEAAATWNQGGKRPGAFAIYLEPWHGDIMTFARLKVNNSGEENTHARDLFYGLWVPDLFVKRVISTKKEDRRWSLFSAHTAPGLCDVYDGMDVCKHCRFCYNPHYNRLIEPAKVRCGTVGGNLSTDNPASACEFDLVPAFTILYERYEREHRAVNVMDIREIIDAFCTMWRESGTPYSCMKDHVNRMSNQNNVDTVRSSNLCVAPNTLILTEGGYVTISSLEGRKVKVWNGNNFSAATVCKTGEVQPLWQIETDNGLFLHCTGDHKMYLADGRCINARDVRPGHELISYDLPGETNTKAVQPNGSSNRSVDTPDFEMMSVMSKWDTSRLEQMMTVLQYQTQGCRLFETAKPGMYMVGRKRPVYVRASFDTGLLSDTYCFNEPERNMGMFNGMLTGQCTEIMQVSTPTSYATCTLASINLANFVDSAGIVDHPRLHESVRIVTRALDNVIEENHYPVEECVENSHTMRPIGIGCMGLANIFAAMRIPFDSKRAEEINVEIAETMYHATMEESHQLGLARGSHAGFKGSPVSRGLLHFDLWRRNQRYIDGELADYKLLSGRYNWDADRVRWMVAMRNSLHLAGMPTVSTSQITGRVESFEPYSSNLYKKTTQFGVFVVSNDYMVRHLMELGLWNKSVRIQITNSGGSIQGVSGIPQHVKDIYKINKEISQKTLMRMTSLIQAFYDQALSQNIQLTVNSNDVFRSVFITGWKLGLKTGSYYIRTSTAAAAINNNVAETVREEDGPVCRMEEGCVSCAL